MLGFRPGPRVRSRPETQFQRCNVKHWQKMPVLQRRVSFLYHQIRLIRVSAHALFDPSLRYVI
jgi:hypothetical protein